MGSVSRIRRISSVVSVGDLGPGGAGLGAFLTALFPRSYFSKSCFVSSRVEGVGRAGGDNVAP